MSASQGDAYAARKVLGERGRILREGRRHDGRNWSCGVVTGERFDVPSTFLLHATAATCGGQSTSSMAYSFDSNTDNVINAQSINQNVSTSAGSHLLRVKAWGNAARYMRSGRPGAFRKLPVISTVKEDISEW